MSRDPVKREEVESLIAKSIGSLAVIFKSTEWKMMQYADFEQAEDFNRFVESYNEIGVALNQMNRTLTSTRVAQSTSGKLSPKGKINGVHAQA